MVISLLQAILYVIFVNCAAVDKISAGIERCMVPLQ